MKLLPDQINNESVEINKKNEYTFLNWKANVNAWLIQKVQYEFDNTDLLDFFSNEDEKKDLIKDIDDFLSTKEKCLYINASNIGTTNGIGTMIIDLISNYMINKSGEKKFPFIMFIDEVHRYTGYKNEANNHLSGLMSIAREGRKKGIFLFLTTQSPKDVPEIILGQIGTMLIHRITNPEELKIIQNYVGNNLEQIKKLNQGEAILASINLLRNVQLSFNASNRIHHNHTPIL